MKSKMGVILGVSLAAVLMLGVTYGLWFQALYIYGTVYTGTLDARWSIHPAWDSEPPEKDYSNITVRACGDDPYTLYVTVENAYPCIWYYALIDLTNTGTIPWKIYDTSLVTEGFPGTVQFVPWDEKFLNLIDLPAQHPQIGEKMFIENGTQVHPGESAWGVFAIHLTNDAQENSTYTFTFKVVVEQWNEWPTKPPAGYDSNEEWLADLAE
ncbi:MAG: hypothetical protein ACO0C9_05100 [Candidatus Methanosuratincola verstraetei]|jgi:hypothetical protein